MKILAFSDLHSNLSALEEVEKKAKKADLVVCAGDFTVFERGIEHIIPRFDRIKKKVLIIHGNHEDENVVERMCGESKNLVFLHKNAIKIDDFVFVGYGGDGFSYIDEDLEAFIKEFSRQAKKSDKIVFVSHAPPYGTKLDVIWGEHHGNKSVTNFIKKFSPVLFVCGHFHETFGIEYRMGRTLMINPGPTGEMIEL